jgi:hypothetical protein
VAFEVVSCGAYVVFPTFSVIPAEPTFIKKRVCRNDVSGALNLLGDGGWILVEYLGNGIKCGTLSQFLFYKNPV